MRLISMVFSIFRAPLGARVAFVAFLCGAFVTASGTPAAAQQSRTHRSVRSEHHHPQAAAIHPTHRSAGRSRTTRYSTARARTTHHRTALVHTRMPIRHYAWMNSHSSAAARRAHETEAVSATSAPVEPAADSPKPGVPAPATSIAEAESADTAEPNTATPQEAADQIAAAEIPSSHAALAAPTSAADPLRSTRIVAMAPLRGSLESLIRQNEKVNADNLERIEDDADLQSRIAAGQLVRVPESSALAVNPSLPDDRRYCRPWTATFLADLSRAHQTQFHHPLEVSSAVRTVEYQKHLMRTNGNAAPAEGDVASPHLTGATIDIAKKGLTRSELYWMRDRLNTLQAEGKIDVEEEFHQACFHITVYKSYIGAGPAHRVQHTTAPPADGADSSSEPAGDPAPGV
jgi:hypothetical protein